MKIWGIVPNGSGIIVLIPRSGVFILIYNNQSLKDPPGICISSLSEFKWAKLSREPMSIYIRKSWFNTGSFSCPDGKHIQNFLNQKKANFRGFEFPYRTVLLWVFWEKQRRHAVFTTVCLFVWANVCGSPRAVSGVAPQDVQPSLLEIGLPLGLVDLVRLAGQGARRTADVNLLSSGVRSPQRHTQIYHKSLGSKTSFSCLCHQQSTN